MQTGASQITVLEERLQKLEYQHVTLQSEHVALQSQHAVLQSQYAQLQSRCVALETQNKELRERVDELQEKLGRNSRNSNQPPSSDQPGEGSRDGRRKNKKSKKRKRGGQPGHRGSHRELLPPEQVDHFVDHFRNECECCGEALPKTPDDHPERFQVTEIPPLRPETTEHRGHEVECPCCGHKNRGHIPDTVKSSAFGVRLTAMVMMLTGALHLSRRQAKEMLKSFFNVAISVGAISAIEGRFAEVIKPVVLQVWEKAREATVKHTDGTSWLQAGKMLQIWTIATAAVTVFKILSDGTARTLRALFRNVEGILVSDRATALKFWVMKNRQICWAHLLRKFISFSERAGPAGAYGRELLEYTAIMFDYYWSYREGRLSSQTFRARMAPLQEHVEAVLHRAVQAGIKGLSGSCEDILAHKEALWNFVTTKGVEPTNNNAERELRRFVLWRKRCFGTQSQRGNDYAECIMTVAHTARKQNRPLLPYLIEVFQAHSDGTELPSLLA